MVRRSASERILREMQEIRHRLDEIEETVPSWNSPSLELQETDLLSLPDHLRKTYLTALSLGQCNATQMSTHTGRCRTIESIYLNQLAQTGWLTKQRTSRNVLFRPIPRRMLKNRNRGDDGSLTSSTTFRRSILERSIPTCGTCWAPTNTSKADSTKFDRIKNLQPIFYLYLKHDVDYGKLMRVRKKWAARREKWTSQLRLS